jgi:hypothetical protein
MYLFVLVTIASLVSYCKTFYMHKKLVLLYDQFPVFIVITVFSIIIFGYLLFLGNKCNRIDESMSNINDRFNEQSEKIDNMISYMEYSHHEVINSDKLLQHFILEILNNIRKE